MSTMPIAYSSKILGDSAYTWSVSPAFGVDATPGELVEDFGKRVENVITQAINAYVIITFGWSLYDEAAIKLTGQSFYDMGPYLTLVQDLAGMTPSRLRPAHHKGIGTISSVPGKPRTGNLRQFYERCSKVGDGVPGLRS